MKLLLVGGSGFIGKSIIDAFNRGLLKKYNIKKIIILSRNPNILKKLPINLRNISLVRSNIGNIKKLPKFNYVIYLAENSTNKILGRIEQKNQKNNIDNFCSIVKNIKNVNILYCSSGAVNEYLKTKNTLSKYKKNYSKLKLYSENKIASLSKHKIKTSIARSYTFVGSWLPLNGHYAIGNFLYSAYKKKNITIKSNKNIIRSYMYADDMVNWLLTILKNSNQNCPIYNVGSDKKTNIIDVAKIIGKIFNKPVKIIFSKRKKTDNYVPNITKSKKDLKLKINYSLLESINLTINHINEKIN